MTVHLVAAAVVFGLMLVLWVVSIRIRDVAIVDPAWGPALGLSALAAAAVGDGDAGRRWLLAAMTLLWGFRLGIHLALRKRREPEEDPRYAAIRRKRGDAFVRWSLYGIFGFQGMLVLIVSLPQQRAAVSSHELTAAVVPGVVIWAIGLAFETIGDAQLTAFKRDPSSKGQVMDRGLWRYTRHPNYFGDACVWWGIWLVALPAGNTWWTVIGPIIMTVLLVRVSGAGLMEKSIGKRRPGYEEYVRRTSGFIPRPPRKS